MKLSDIYNTAIQLGIACDPRGKEFVRRELGAVKKKFEKLTSEEKEEFDKERLSNPYADTRILYGQGQEEIKTMLVGIDIDVGEVLLAEYLKTQGRRPDVIISHHPEGRALASLYEVMNMQAEIFRRYGIPIHLAEGIMETRVKEIERKLLPANHRRAVDAASLLKIPFLCIHTPADNAVTDYLNKILKKEKLETVGEVLNRLKKIAEYKESLKQNAGPKIILGGAEKRVGRIMVDMTGGTEESEYLLEKFSQAGVGTMVCMHMGEKHVEEAKKHHLNVIIAGHIASDNLGLNQILDRLDPRGTMEVISCSGFTRIKNSQR